MPDQDYVVLLALLCAVLLITAVIPAPARAPRHEVGANLTLLGVGAALAILAGVLALAQLPVHSAFCGSLAWLTVMPCLWMARGPWPAEGYDADEDEDDGGGEPWSRWPGAPPSPDGRRPQLAPASLADVRVASARPVVRPSTAAHLQQPAVASHRLPPSPAPPAAAPPAPSAALAPGEAAAPPAAVESAVPSRRRRLSPRPRGERGDHRSIVHKRAAQPHTGRRRRASLRRRVLRRCRMWLWVPPPECVTFVEPDHDQLRQRPGSDRDRDARFTPQG